MEDIIMSELNEIKEIEKLLKTLGTLEDYSEYVKAEYKNQILKVYDLYENKYNDSCDDSLCIEVHINGTCIITNDDLPYDVLSVKDYELLKNVFENTPFELKINEHKHSNISYYGSAVVTATANNLSELKNLILQYRACNDRFLSDKVEEIKGDDGKIYLDRRN
ncbi:hypothetical protein D352_00150 [Enterococcus faecium LA4B-2]|nr:hypothetical protein D352_00150 [Enterococcus faecium LA4B-2]